MRIDAQSIEGLVTSLNNLNDKQADLSNELSTGVRLNHLSDDSIAAGEAVTLSDSLRRDDTFLSTASSAGNRMQAADTALSSVVTQLTSAVSTAVAAYNGSTGADARSIAVQQLKAVRDSLLSLANSSYGGSYLFAGSSTAVPFTQAADGAVTYTGNQDALSVQVESGGTITVSLSGSSIFLAPGATVFGALNGLITDLSQTSSTGGSASLVSSLRDALSNVTGQRALLNTAQKRLSDESDYVTAQKANRTVQQSTLLAADTASVATDLSTVTAQRTALLNTIGLLQKDSLFDYLR